MYFVGYGMGRFWIEGLRTDSLYLFQGLRISQVVSLFLIILGIILYIYKNTKISKVPEYCGKYLKQ